MTKEAPTAQTYWEARFDPASTDIEVLAAGDPALADNNANITCSYNDTGELHMLSKPMPTPGEGEVVLHVHATGICG
jgi:L-iditol 2-dehydrogenase